MSDQAPPPRKIGSLRDRIAAFEHKDPPAPVPTPAPRPKPGQVKWQPRERSPPPAAPTHADVSAAEPGEGGMNASDAAESVGKMSLKERMAALQGRGGFGAPPPAAPALQRTEKKWQPPPRPEPASASEHEDEGAVTGEERSVRSPVRSPMSALAEIERKEEEPEEPAGDEEEERKRRAAIAARMARLGGARFGMGPPVGAPRPAAKPHHEHEESEKSPEGSSDAGGMKVDLPDAPSQTSLLLSDSSSAKSPPASMPIPSHPRRAGPPRRRPPKSPGGSTTDLTESGSAAAASEGVDPSSATPVNAQERSERKVEPEAEEEEEREETEEEAAARRKRIAERIAKQGGLNFLSAPRPAEEEDDEGEAAAATEDAHLHHPGAENEQGADSEREAEAVGGTDDVSEVEGEHAHEHMHESGVEGEGEGEGEEQAIGHAHDGAQHGLHEDIQATVAHLQHDADLDPSFSRSHSGFETESSLGPSGELTEESVEAEEGEGEEEEAPPPLPPKRDGHVPFPKTTDEVEFPSKQASGDAGRHAVGSGSGGEGEEEDVRGHVDVGEAETEGKHVVGSDQSKQASQHAKMQHADDDDEEEEEQWEK